MFLDMNGKHHQHNATQFIYPSYFSYRQIATKKLCETPANYFHNEEETLSNDEIIEQCLSLIKAIIAISDMHVRESLTFILEEKLLFLASRLN